VSIFSEAAGAAAAAAAAQEGGSMMNGGKPSNGPKSNNNGGTNPNGVPVNQTRPKLPSIPDHVPDTDGGVTTPAPVDLSLIAGPTDLPKRKRGAPKGALRCAGAPNPAPAIGCAAK
jgi:hypothetical protein